MARCYASLLRPLRCGDETFQCAEASGGHGDAEECFKKPGDVAGRVSRFPAGAGRAAAVDPAELDELIAAPHRELDWRQEIRVEERDHRSVDVLGRVRFWGFPNDVFELGHGAHDHAVGVFPVAEAPKRVARGGLRGCRGEEDCAVGLKVSRHRWSSECRDEFVAGWAASVAEVEISKERDLGHGLASSSMTWAVALGWVIIGQCPVSRVLNVQPGVLALMSAAGGAVERH